VALQKVQRGKQARRSLSEAIADEPTPAPVTSETALEAVAAVVAVGVAVPTPMVGGTHEGSDELYKAAAVAVQSAERGRKARKSLQSTQPAAEQLSAKELRTLVGLGFRATEEGDWAAARLNFLVAYERGERKIEHGISAANMSLRIGDFQLAAAEYMLLLERRDLTEYHRRCVGAKLQQAQRGMLDTRPPPAPNPLLVCLQHLLTPCLPAETDASVPTGRPVSRADLSMQFDDQNDAVGDMKVERVEVDMAKAATPPSRTQRRSLGGRLAIMSLIILFFALFTAALFPEEVSRMQVKLAQEFQIGHTFESSAPPRRRGRARGAERATTRR